ncbi:MAG: FHA domain-containing protein [Streptosporangiaceae bacterium]
MNSQVVLPRRMRKRWVVAAAIAASWLLMLYLTGSFVGGTALLLLLVVLGVCCVISLRAIGFGADHPWVRHLATRPWRDGQDVLRLSMRHLPDVFVTTPSGVLLAPNAVELRLNPRDLGSLTETMDIGLIGASATEVYVDQVAGHGARFTGSGPAEVRVVPDPSVAEGRFVLRQGRPVPPGSMPYEPVPYEPVPSRAVPSRAERPGGALPVTDPRLRVQQVEARHLEAEQLEAQRLAAGRLRAGSAAGFQHAHDGSTRTEATLAPADLFGRRDTLRQGMATMAEPRVPAVPQLRLVTGDLVAQTRTSGARAGRGAVELALPQVPTISREHARFTFADGQWWVTNLGRNGLMLNGVPVAGDQPVRDGDSIRWGGKPDALASRVEIG